MSELYLAYLALAAGGCIALSHFFQVSFSPRLLRSGILAILAAAFFFAGWNTLAVEWTWWSFGWEHTLNVPILSQPLEEFLFLLVIPAFGLVVWGIAGKFSTYQNGARKR